MRVPAIDDRLSNRQHVEQSRGTGGSTAALSNLGRPIYRRNPLYHLFEQQRVDQAEQIAIHVPRQDSRAGTYDARNRGFSG